MFVILAKKLGSQVAIEDVPPIPQLGHLSGADIEGMVGRAWRSSILAGADHVTREALAGVVAEFMPSTQGSNASCRRPRRFSSAPTGSSCRLRSSRRPTSRAAARHCRSG